MTDLTIDKIPSGKKNLERVLDSLKEGIIAHDLNRRIFFFNRAAEQITGFKREEVLGKDCHDSFGTPFCGERCSFCEADPKSKEKVKGHATCSHCGNEADMWIDL